MVAFGDPRAANPFDVDCPAHAAGRWIDDRSFVIDFDAPLPGGLRCRFTLRARTRSLAGVPLAGPRAFAFTTGGPSVVSADPPSGAAIAEDQRFLLKLDGAATPESVLSRAAFRVAGLRDPVGVRLVEGEERAALLRTRYVRDDEAPRWLVLEARQHFPQSAKVELIWGAGIRSPEGVATAKPLRFAYRTRKPFEARLVCAREHPDADCLPFGPLRVVFSAPLHAEDALRVTLRRADGAEPERRAERRWEREGDALVDSVIVRGPFAEGGRYVLDVPADLHDDLGRPLANARRFPLDVAIGPLPPLAKFAASFGVLERSDPLLPVTLRRIEPDAVVRGARLPEPALAGRDLRIGAGDAAAVLGWLRRVEDADRERSVFAGAGAPAAQVHAFSLPPAASAADTEVIGIPLREPGLHVVEIESRVLGASLLKAPAPLFVASAALVTNLAVHLAWGDESSIAWVTTLDGAAPVAGARVRVFDCEGGPRFDAETDRDGLVRLAGIAPRDRAPRCEGQGYGRYAGGLLVTAEHGDDLAFVHSSWDDGLEAFRFDVPTAWRSRHVAAHTIFDRTLLRAGETVHMKHVLRRETMSGFAFPDAAARPAKLRLRHEGTGETVDLDVDFDAGGVATTDWAIPREAKLGSYEVSLVLPKQGDEPAPEETSGSFRVEEFRVPLARGVVQLPSEPPVAPRAVPADLAVSYLSGGGAGGLPVTLRTQLRPGAVSSPEGFPGVVFDRGALREGRRRVSDESDDETAGRAAPLPARAESLVLDATGTLHTEIGALPEVTKPTELVAELEFRDPNGQTQTAAAKTSLWPAARRIGIAAGVAPPTLPESDEEAAGPGAKPRLRADVVVLDVAGRPVRSAEVEVALLERRDYSSRRRLVGGFYAYESFEEVTKRGALCSGRTDRTGRLRCEGIAPGPGWWALEATVRDDAGRASASWDTTWIDGDAEAWLAPGNSDRMDLVPEHARYEPGDVAKLRVAMPFRRATALVSVQREGVARAFVTTLSGRRPVVEVPIEAGDAPNVFVSVLALRGRVAGPQPTARVDLARPTLRLGIAELEVGRRGSALSVQVRPDRETHRVRDTARVAFRVLDADGDPPPPGAELAVAVVDEGLLELQPNASWSLQDAMLGRRAYAVQTSSAQTEVIGRRHFGAKALPPGGGGGRRGTRELFDTLLLWRARVPVDAEGRASVDVPLNDSLTSFRIAAVATAGPGLFGSGFATIRSTQELMILPGLAPVVREGDRTHAGFTLRNTTKRKLEIALAAKVEGLGAPLPEQTLALAAGEAREAGWDVDVPSGVPRLVYEVEVHTRGEAADRLRAVQRVVPVVPDRVLQATLLRVGDAPGVPVAPPRDALPGRGGVDVTLRPSLAVGGEGAVRWMLAYPHACLEQEASRAVVLGDADRWRTLAATLPGRLDADGLLTFFPGMEYGSDVLTAYVLQIADEAGLALPPPVLARTTDGLRRFVDGSLKPRDAVRRPDLPLRRIAALAALARHGAVTPAMLAAVEAGPERWPTATVLDWLEIWTRVPSAPGREARIAEAERVLAARLSLQGTKLAFTTGERDAQGWLLATPDANAARLVLSAIRSPRRRDEAPRLVRGLLARQRDGRWDTTTANAWGVLALRKFSAAFEAEPVAGTTEATLAGVTRELAWTDAAPAPLRFPWPAAPSILALRQRGSGRPFGLVQSVAAVPLAAPVESGLAIEKTWTPIAQRTPGVFSRGDVVRVTLRLRAKADESWVALTDPIPAGATILGSGLGGDSSIATGAASGEDEAGCPCAAYTERGFESFRRYWSEVPAGEWTVEYALRLDQEGRFGLPPSRIEALYAPEVFGEIPGRPVEVLP